VPSPRVGVVLCGAQFRRMGSSDACTFRLPFTLAGGTMSVQAISWVIEQSKHKGNSFVVLLMIANHARSDGTGAWPSIKTLAKEARISERTVQYTIKRLCRTSRSIKPELYCEKGKGPHGTNLYTISKMGGAGSAPLVQVLQEGGARYLHRGGATAIAPEPSLNRPSEIRRIRYCSICGRTASWHINAKRRGQADHDFSEAA